MAGVFSKNDISPIYLIAIFLLFLCLVIQSTKISYGGEYDEFEIYCSGYWQYSGSYGGHTCIESFTAAPSECNYAYRSNLTGGCIPDDALDCGNGNYCSAGSYCSPSNEECIVVEPFE